MGHVFGSGRLGLYPTIVEAVSKLAKKPVHQIIGLFGFWRAYVLLYSEIAKNSYGFKWKGSPNMVV